MKVVMILGQLVAVVVVLEHPSRNAVTALLMVVLQRALAMSVRGYSCPA
jgi:hypothetical protein